MWDMTARCVGAAMPHAHAGASRGDPLFQTVTGSAELFEPFIGGSVFLPIRLRRYTQMPMGVGARANGPANASARPPIGRR